MSKNLQEKIKELTLLLLWLTSWDEIDKLRKDKRFKDLGPSYRAWKGYDFETLDKLKKEELINFSYRAKSVYLTKEGVVLAKKLEKKYL